MNWWLGDALAEGEAMLGEEYAQVESVADCFGINRDRLRQCQWVAERVEPAVRTPALSWSHHYRVAALPRDEQLKRLAEAAAEEWTVSELRREVAANGKPDPVADLRLGYERVLDRLDELVPLAVRVGQTKNLEDARLAVWAACARAGGTNPLAPLVDPSAGGAAP
jgi:hypothetical protein